MTDDLHGFESESSSTERGRRRTWPAFLVGLLLGVVAALVLPPLLSPYVPDALRRGGEEVVGVVADKQREEQRLLLMVRAQQGAILATFDRRVAEIDLLVSPGDTVTLGVSAYEPFVENPVLRGVRKVDPARAEQDARPRATDPAASPRDTLPPTGRTTPGEADTLRRDADTMPRNADTVPRSGEADPTRLF